MDALDTILICKLSDQQTEAAYSGKGVVSDEKTIFISVLALIFLFTATASAANWSCPNCGQRNNTKNFCPTCGEPRPAAATKSVPAYTIGQVRVGDHINFGTYADEKIEWRVLDTNGNTALLISEIVLEAKPFSIDLTNPNMKGPSTWADSALRKWLIGEFYNTAFNIEEREHILKTKVIAEDNDLFEVDAGRDTEDYIYLLSISETIKYFRDDYDRICYETYHAKKNFE